MKNTFGILACTLFFGLQLHGMVVQELSKSEQIAKLDQLPKSMQQFPAYIYFLGLHSLPLDDCLSSPQKPDPVPLKHLIKEYSKEELKRLILVVQGKNPKCAVEFLNFWAALVCAQITLLPKPLKDWSLEDLLKIHALIMYGLPSDDEQPLLAPGTFQHRGFRTTHAVSEKGNPLIFGQGLSDEELNSMESAGNKIAASEPLRNLTDVAKILSDKEYQVWTQMFKMYPDYTHLPELMRQFLADLGQLTIQDMVNVAAYIHHTLVTIHPMSNGNGRLARLLSNIALLKGGMIPFYLDSAEDKFNYMDALWSGKCEAFSDYLNSKMAQKKQTHKDDMKTPNGTSIFEEPKQEVQKTILRLFEQLDLSHNSATATLGLIKQYALSKLELHPCLYCNKISKDFKRCSRCQIVHYCSAECQKKIGHTTKLCARRQHSRKHARIRLHKLQAAAPTYPFEKINRML